jgi:hypothetical protein
MAEVRAAVDRFSVSSLIERSEQRVARQRQIVDELRKFNAAGPAQRLLAIMEHTLAGLREQERGANILTVPKPAPNLPA